MVTVHDVILSGIRTRLAARRGNAEVAFEFTDPARDVSAVSKFTKNDFCDLSGFPLTGSSSHTFPRAWLRPIQDRRFVRAFARGGAWRTSRFFFPSPILSPQKHPPPHPSILQCRNAVASWPGRLASWVTLKWDGAETIDRELAKNPEFANRIVRARGVSDEDLACLYSESGLAFPSTYEGFDCWF